MTDPRIELLQRRLYGSANRIAWRVQDAAMIARRMGFEGFSAERLVPVDRKASPGSAAAVEENSGSGSYTFTISTGAVDRMGDTIAVQGWKLGAYRANPQVLWGHDFSRLPIGRANKVWIDGGRLKATMSFAPASINRQAEQVRQMLHNKLLAATSVGFLPLKFKFSEDADRKYGIDFLEQELLEFSIVTIPANSEALIDPSQAEQARPFDERERKRKARERDFEIIRLRASD